MKIDNTEKVNTDLSAQNANQKIQIDDLIRQNTNLNEDIARLEAQSASQLKQIESLTNGNKNQLNESSQLHAKITTLSLQVDGLIQANDDLKEENARLGAKRDELSKSLIESQEFCMSLEQKAHQQSVNSIEMMEALKQCEEELDYYKKLIA